MNSVQSAARSSKIIKKASRVNNFELELQSVIYQLLELVAENRNLQIQVDQKAQFINNFELIDSSISGDPTEEIIAAINNDPLVTSSLSNNPFQAQPSLGNTQVAMAANDDIRALATAINSRDKIQNIPIFSRSVNDQPIRVWIRDAGAIAISKEWPRTPQKRF